MSVVRIRKNTNFTVVSNYLIDDNRLTPQELKIALKAVRSPDDWEYTITGLTKLCGMGRDAVTRGLKHLEELGYLVRRDSRGENGRFGKIEYIFFEIPLVLNPKMSAPKAVEFMSEDAEKLYAEERAKRCQGTADEIPSCSETKVTERRSNTHKIMPCRVGTKLSTPTECVEERYEDDSAAVEYAPEETEVVQSAQIYQRADSGYTDDVRSDELYRDNAYSDEPYRDNAYSDEPYTGSAYSDEPHSGEPYRDEPYADEPCTGFPDTVEPRTAEQAQLNKNYINTISSSTTESRTISTNKIHSAANPINPSFQRKVEQSIDRIDRIEQQREIVRNQLDYYIKLMPENDACIEDMVEIVIEVNCCNPETMIRVNNELVPAAVVQKMFRRLTWECLLYVRDCMRNNPTKIRNIRNYILTALYNAPQTIVLHYDAQVNYDLHGRSA